MICNEKVKKELKYKFKYNSKEAFAQFLRGIAFNCENLVGRPKKTYLSGGLCMNPAFVQSFTCETIPLGRFVLIEGLRKIALD